MKKSLLYPASLEILHGINLFTQFPPALLLRFYTILLKPGTLLTGPRLLSSLREKSVHTLLFDAAGWGQIPVGSPKTFVQLLHFKTCQFK